MIVFCVYWGNTFQRFARVLERSVRANCPTGRIVTREGAPARALPQVPQHATNNTGKLELWNQAVQAAEEEIVLLDADMLVLGDLAEAFEGEFDFAYTIRPGLRRIQAGAMYVRPTEAGKRFMFELTLKNDELLDDPLWLDTLIEKYGGANQAALSLLVEEYPPDDVCLAELPCEIWNSCYQTWGTFGPETRVLHLTGRLRRAAMEGRLHPSGPYKQYNNMLEHWLKYARG